MPSLGMIPRVPEINWATAPYQQVAEHYRAEIRAGRLAPGALMPTTKEVAVEYRLAMSTAARALAVLRDEGWIVTRPSKPAVVVGVPDTSSHQRKP